MSWEEGRERGRERKNSEHTINGDARSWWPAPVPPAKIFHGIYFAQSPRFKIRKLDEIPFKRDRCQQVDV